MPLFYLQKFFSVFIAVACVTLGILTFDNALLFDRLFMVVVILIAIPFYKNINILGILLIILGFRFADEIAWQIVHNTLFWKVCIYSALTLSVYKLEEDSLRYSILFTVLCAVSAEIYWYFTDYDSPRIVWLAFQILLTFISRRLFFFRYFITSKYYPNKVESLSLDRQLYKLMLFPIVLQQLLLLEYLARHIWGFESLYVYSAVPYISRVLYTYMLWMILNESFNLLMSRSFRT